jgi:hypothetical protein
VVRGTGEGLANKERRAEIGLRDEATRLSKDRMKGTTIYFSVIGNSQGLSLPVLEESTNLQVTASLRKPFKSERAQDGKNLAFRKALSVLASGNSVEFHRGQDGRIVDDAECGKIFAFKVESDCFADVYCQLIERGRLRYNRQIKAFGNELLLSSADTHLNRSLH